MRGRLFRSAGAAASLGAAAAAAAAAASASRLSQAESASEAAARLPPATELGLNRGSSFACFRPNGERAALSEIIAAAEKADVVLLGETHDDPVAHQLQLYLLMMAQQSKPCVLSLEMFERDVQPVIDEYLAGLIREKDLMQDARPWANYESDYRPMVEFCRQHGMPVIAANVPRRYVGAVGRLGAKKLADGSWPAASHAFMPPLPLPKPSAGYLAHLMADPAILRTDQIGLQLGPEEDEEAPPAPALSMEAAAAAGKCPYIGLSKRDGLLQPMLLWDAGMAHSIAAALEAHPGHLVFHVCGSFHCEGFHGITEMLNAYRPQARVLVVIVYAESDCDTFVPERHAGQADFVLLADARLPRSHDYFEAPTAEQK